ncbi:hypothetical protein Pmani_020661 [Petrolisthes manimaculis]|uniref:Uncharacterized protein n=1 Tax=Petrolisthes manimaculis TaxID=1843537 RepID=A0AAE1U2U5_9EUCA|nr:hypothetical protein Pmani_020661 [Petrolisthes manimaculis]
MPARGSGGRGLGAAGSPLLPRPQRRTLPPSRSLSLDTGLDSNGVISDPETATDVVSSCEQYLQQQHLQQVPTPSYTQAELRPPRRRLSSIPCDSSPIAEEECGMEDEVGSSTKARNSGDISLLTDDASRSSVTASRRSSVASTDDISRKSSFVDKCMTRVRGFIKK